MCKPFILTSTKPEPFHANHLFFMRLSHNSYILDHHPPALVTLEPGTRQLRAGPAYSLLKLVTLANPKPALSCLTPIPSMETRERLLLLVPHPCLLTNLFFPCGCRDMACPYPLWSIMNCVFSSMFYYFAFSSIFFIFSFIYF